jgi:hypothetical protein
MAPKINGLSPYTCQVTFIQMCRVRIMAEEERDLGGAEELGFETRPPTPRLPIPT